jgi:hypothetical protein
MDMFLLGPVPEIENHSQTSKGVLFVTNIAKSLLNFVSWCYQKVKKVAILGAKSLMKLLSWSCKKVKCSQLTICFAVFIIVMISLVPTIFYHRLYNLDYLKCNPGSYEVHITAKDMRCAGWFEFRYLNLIKYFPMCSNIH